MTGLVQGDHYLFSVRASNGIGLSPNSSASNVVLIASAPAAPLVGRTIAGNGMVTVYFAPPSTDGGAGIADYTIVAVDTSSPSSGFESRTSSAGPIVVGGLTNGHAYRSPCRPPTGWGPDRTRPRRARQCRRPCPAVPAIGTATAGNGSARITFDSPASTGELSITNFVVTAIDTTTSSTQGGQSRVASSGLVTIIGLVNGDHCKFIVRATNAVGLGPVSPTSNMVYRKVTLP